MRTAYTLILFNSKKPDQGPTEPIADARRYFDESVLDATKYHDGGAYHAVLELPRAEVGLLSWAGLYDAGGDSVGSILLIEDDNY